MSEDTNPVGYHDDPADYRRRLEAKLVPQRIRDTMEFAALYQMINEAIRHAVLDEVRQFFTKGYADGKWIIDEDQYRKHVLDRDRSTFTASVGWLVDVGAIKRPQARRLTTIYAHRNELTHELIKYIIDPDVEPDVELLTDAIDILKSIRRFWTGVEADIGTFDEFDDLDLDEVMPLSLMVLQTCLDAYVDGRDSDGGSGSAGKPDPSRVRTDAIDLSQ